MGWFLLPFVVVFSKQKASLTLLAANKFHRKEANSKHSGTAGKNSKTAETPQKIVNHAAAETGGQSP